MQENSIKYDTYKKPYTPKTKQQKTCNDFLEETIETLKQREGEHGSKEECFLSIASYWSEYLDKSITSSDVR